ncbi:uncharacterized protein LOC126917422 [Bombus affinis]|uniref:uncharacterized protein LOC126917422 n=1 Tax=Bombus affinis TaxID=309941 RepID=UPI0021B74E51|nr:uncharacterized protein LOC126917422 [Bombus affinis]
MAIIGRIGRAVSTACRKFNGESRFRWSSDGKRIKAWFGFTAATIGSCGVVLYFLNDSSVKAFGGIEIRLPKYPWAFNGTFKAFDHAALRRGWQVYRTVCHACHSLRFVRFLDLVNVTHTAEEVKQIAAEFQVEDGPDDQGNYYTRPAILSDAIPSPYPNEEAAKTANYGAVPPDLTYMILTRRRGLDYVFSLLTGWMDPPAGVTPDEGQYFNVYFTGGSTTMPRVRHKRNRDSSNAPSLTDTYFPLPLLLLTLSQMFYEGIIEYDDGTPATESQLAKDVVEFLMWTASSEHDTRKIMTLKCIGIFLMLLVSVVHINRRNWSHLRSRRIAYVPNTITREPRHPTSPFADKYGRGSKRGGSLPN